MNIMKKTKAAVACLLSLTMFAGMGAIATHADEANPNRYEVEAGVLSGSAAIVTTPTAGADVSGGAFVGSLGNDGGYVEITVVADEAGERNVTIGYCSWEARSIDISVNGGEYVNIPTMGNNSNWNGDVMVATTLLYLNAGENVLKIGNVNAWAPNVDYVELGILDEEAKAAAVAALAAEAAALPETVDHSTFAAYESVATKYAGLTDAQKALLTDDQKATVEAAVAAYNTFNESLDQAEVDRVAAGEVATLIDAIGEVTADSESAITAARTAYDALTDAQKAYVSPGTLKKLTNAEEALNAIKNPTSDNNATQNNQQNTNTDDTSDDGDNTTTIVIVVIVAVVVVAGVVVVVLMRKKKD